ncbi:MAG TPA: hypothetical protein VGM80_09080 [Gaiellaceae bacterium]
MADKEHRAAKAGRYVRAAGIVLGREIDRRAAAAEAKPAPVPPPPPPPGVPTGDLFGKAIFGLFMVAIVCLALVILHALDLIHGTSGTIVRLIVGVIMLLEAALLTSNWSRANERIGQRLLTRMWGPYAATNRRQRTVARIVRDGLTLLGIGFLAAGVFAVLVALFGTP